MPLRHVIDLDANATTPIDPRVLEAMRPHLLIGGNPESRHSLGRSARQVWDDAREAIAAMLGAHADELVLTSGGTESNNMALYGLINESTRLRSSPEEWSRPTRVLVSGIEHPAVAEPLALLEKQGRVLREFGPIRPDGTADIDCWLDRIAADEPLDLVVLMLANNETGAIQDVATVARAVAARHIVMHTDAVQAVGRMDVDFSALGVTTLAAGSHKMHGPPGIGILLIRRGQRIAPMFQGGGQQLGMRPGTPAVALAVGLAEAMRLWETEKADRIRQWQSLGSLMTDTLRAKLEGTPVPVIVNGPEDPAKRLPQTLSLFFDHPAIEGELLLMRLDLAGLAVSLGSACASGSTKASPALEAMGLNTRRSKSSIRISFSAFTTPEKVARSADLLASILLELIAPPADDWPEF
jgi:cysteine desulfurase